MDIVVKQGDELVIQVDVSDAAGEPLDMSEADVRFVVDGELDVTDGDDEVQIIDGLGTDDRIQLTFVVDYPAGRYAHECKVQTDENGPVTVLEGTLFVSPTLIEDIQLGS